MFDMECCLSQDLHGHSCFNELDHYISDNIGNSHSVKGWHVSILSEIIFHFTLQHIQNLAGAQISSYLYLHGTLARSRGKEGL